MALYRCNSCRGEYQDTLPHGVTYFHACAPLNNPAWQPPTIINALGVEVPNPLYNAVTPRELPRPGARNENITQASPGAPAQPVQDGLGRTLI